VAKQSVGFNATTQSNLKSMNQGQYAADNSIRLIDANSAESEISFVSVDIPLNLKFSLSKFTFTTGISSLVYINEKSTSNFTSEVTNMVYNSLTTNYDAVNTVETYSVTEESENFSHFDFAGLFNLAVSYDIPLSKGSIAFEPYVKIPVSGMTSNDIKVGSGGIAVRYNF